MKQSKKSNFFRHVIGHTIFTNISAKDALDQKSTQMIKQKSWQIYLNSKWTYILLSMSKSQCQLLSLRFQNNHTPQTINSIPPMITLLSGITFSSLKILDLGFNKIESIEGLAFLEMQSLQNLMLPQNKLISIKPLSKTKWRNLLNLGLFGCTLKSTSFEINRTKISQSFSCISFNAYKSKSRIQNMNSLVKVQAGNIYALSFSNSEQMIRQQKIAKVLMKRFLTNNMISWVKEEYERQRPVAQREEYA